MSVPSRFAGFESPEALVADGSLTRAEKVTALHAWRSLVERGRRAGLSDAERLVDAIDRAMERVRPGPPAGRRPGPRSDH